MATRMEPMAGPSLPLLLRRSGGRISRGRRPAGTFVGDELLEPADFALAGVEAVALQLQGVRVEAFSRPGQHLAQPFPAFLDPAAAPLQDAQPGVRVRAGEEREMDTERRILVRLRSGL